MKRCALVILAISQFPYSSSQPPSSPSFSYMSLWQLQQLVTRKVKAVFLVTKLCGSLTSESQ